MHGTVGCVFPSLIDTVLFSWLEMRVDKFYLNFIPFPQTVTEIVHTIYLVLILLLLASLDSPWPNMLLWIECSALMQSDTAWWVLGFTCMWEETDLSLCNFYAGDGHLGKNFEAASCSHCGVTTPYAFPCRRWNCHVQVGVQIHKDCDLAIISKKSEKKSWDISLDLVP